MRACVGVGVGVGGVGGVVCVCGRLGIRYGRGRGGAGE